jgi:hypothetical protein
MAIKGLKEILEKKRGNTVPGEKTPDTDSHGAAVPKPPVQSNKPAKRAAGRGR